MKKILILLTILLLLAGCAPREAAPQADNYRWTLSSVQSNKDGSILARAPGELLPGEGAQALRMECTVSGDTLTLADLTNARTYSGSLHRTQTDLRATLYEVSLEGRSGPASVAMTRHHDGTQIPTFIIRLDSCTLTFHAAAE